MDDVTHRHNYCRISYRVKAVVLRPGIQNKKEVKNENGYLEQMCISYSVCTYPLLLPENQALFQLFLLQEPYLWNRLKM